MRAWTAVFIGSFFLSLLYSTKSDEGPIITIARKGDTALVLDTSARAARASDTLTAAIADSAGALSAAPAPAIPGGSSAPGVVPADLDALKGQGLVIPVAGVAAKDLVDSFDDMRGGTRHHNALDIMAARNTPVLAALPGKVLQLHNSEAGGLTIYMSDPSSRFVLMYGHLDSYKPGLAKGQSVKRGDIIGFVGSTGNANPAAPHLHFQITRNDNMSEWWKGTPINPFLIFRPQG